MFAEHSYAQKIKYERVNITYYKMPTMVLDSTYKTYAVVANIPDYMGGNYAAASMSYTLQHLKKATSPADIEVLLNYGYYKQMGVFPPIINKLSHTNKVNGVEVTTHGYNKSCSYEQPFEYKIVDNKTGQKITHKIDSWTCTITTQEYATEAEAHQAWDGVLRAQITQIQTANHNKLAASINGIISNAFYKGDAPATVDLYKMKDKEDYADLDSAFNMAIAAYKLLSNHQNDSREDFIKAIQPAMQIWQSVIAQKEDSKKARVNPKIANVVLYNLASAAYWSKDWDTAINYAKVADENGKSDFWVKDFIKNTEIMKKR